MKLVSARIAVALAAAIGASIAIWWFNRGDAPEVQAHAERFGIFVGLWAPTLLILSNRFDRYADKANEVPGLKPEHHEENRDEEVPK